MYDVRGGYLIGVRNLSIKSNSLLVEIAPRRCNPIFNFLRFLYSFCLDFGCLVKPTFRHNFTYSFYILL